MSSRLPLFLALAILVFFAPQTSAQHPTSATPAEGLVAATKELDSLFAAMPEPNRSGWRRYLKWESWGPPILAGQQPDRIALENATAQFFGVHEGLETPALLRMREAMVRYLGDKESSSNIGLHPAVVVRVRQDLLSAELEKMATTRVEVKDTGNWIAGAWVTGQAQCQMNVAAKLASYRGQAAIEVRMEGTIEAPQTVAQKGRFSVFGSAESQLRGTAYLYLENDLIRISQPEFIANTQSQISSVDGPRLLRGIAERQAHKMLAHGESESSQLIASQASQEFKQELEAEIAKSTTSQASWDLYQQLLKRSDLAPTQIVTSLADQSVVLGIQFPASGAKAPPSETPLADGAVAEISMHESLLGAISSNFVRGAWWTDVDFARLQKELTGSNANELLIGATPTRWSVRWDWNTPVDERITNAALEYRLRFSGAKIDERDVTTPFLIIAKYKPAATRWGLEFARVGEIELLAEGPMPKGDEQLLLRKFGGLFTDLVYLDGISPPAGGGWDDVARYATNGVRLEEGWFRIDFRLEAKPTKNVGAK